MRSPGGLRGPRFAEPALPQEEGVPFGVGSSLLSPQDVCAHLPRAHFQLCLMASDLLGLGWLNIHVEGRIVPGNVIVLGVCQHRGRARSLHYLSQSSPPTVKCSGSVITPILNTRKCRNESLGGSPSSPQLEGAGARSDIGVGLTVDRATEQSCQSSGAQSRGCWPRGPCWVSLGGWRARRTCHVLSPICISRPEAGGRGRCH